jgi:hypothetical protein
VKFPRLFAAALAALLLAGCSGDRVLWNSNGQFGKEGEREIWDRNGQMESGERVIWRNKDGEKVIK